MGSSLYLEISDQELERLVSETLSARLISARILTGGLFNTTYLPKARGHLRGNFREGGRGRRQYGAGGAATGAGEPASSDAL